MIRPQLAVINIGLSLVTIGIEVIVLIIYFTFIGLEILGILACIAIILSNIVGIMTYKEDFPLDTRKNIFTVDYVMLIITILIEFGMLTGSLLATTVYILVFAFLGTIPFVEVIVQFFGISIIPFVAIIVMKAVASLLYLIIFIISIISAIVNRRHNHRTEV
ncbi:uncharacterized protein LOC129581404 [Paramacrobiotus metropolitanus]|uniref:uncharacterized protein LOC129581404 n=1 Tax=Paramacrobiotus metropolitanus TaxID=2943436 RepID=UPI002445A522|nr:uncharacterized protein LOC129581404 [Paramacrobiotus metropolitanus]